MAWRGKKFRNFGKSFRSYGRSARKSYTKYKDPILNYLPPVLATMAEKSGVNRNMVGLALIVASLALKGRGAASRTLGTYILFDQFMKDGFKVENPFAVMQVDVNKKKTDNNSVTVTDQKGFGSLQYLQGIDIPNANVSNYSGLQVNASPYSGFSNYGY